MINASRFARPYARAAFDYAQEHQQLEKWTIMLRTLSEYIQQPLVIAALKNPEYNAENCCDIVLALAQNVLDQAGQNFVKILATHQRLAVLPDIYLLFEQLRASIQKTRRVQVKSAVVLSENHSAKLNAALSKQLGCPIELEQTLDPNLLGGFVVYAGDRVIDSSVLGQLRRLRDVVTG